MEISINKSSLRCIECHRIVYFSKDDIFEGRCLGVATNEIKFPFWGVNIIVSKL